MERTTTSLDGAWRLARYDEDAAGDAAAEPTPSRLLGLDWIDAHVPGSVLSDLVVAGRLENPLASTAAAKAAAWVAECDWLYSLEFGADSATIEAGSRSLMLDGVDTFADFWLNGVHVGSTENAFRFYRLNISHVRLAPTANTLMVLVQSHYPRLAEKQDAAARIAVGSNPSAFRVRSLIRRYQRQFNTSLLNLGAEVISIGLYGSVSILACDETHVDEHAFAVQRADASSAEVAVTVSIARPANDVSPLLVEASLTIPGEQAPSLVATVETTGNTLTIPLSIADPRLWWPRGYGDQPLYRLRIDLYREGSRVDSVSRSVGIKQSRLILSEPNGRDTLVLEINGRRINVRGGNMMPIDAINARASMPEYERMIRLAEHANMNLIRLWGGGVPEPDAFLDLCDERGIMIWQDFLYHSATYPDFDADFMAEAEREAIGLIKHYRSHACLSILCGGNEQMQGWDEWNWRADIDRHYGERLFDELLPSISATEAPEIPYIPNSPYGGSQCQSPVTGDTHTWGNFYNATKDPLFVTETCWIFDSYSRPETLRESMGLDVDQYAEHGWREKLRDRTGLGLFTKFPYTSYQRVGSLREYLRSLEIEQLEADFQALAMLRLRSPSCNGIIYWPLNKGGPLFGFGAIDYAGRPLMAHYAVRRLFADVVLGIYRDVEDVRVVASNATGRTIDGVLRLNHLNSAGQVLGRWQSPVAVKPGNSVRLQTVEALAASVRLRTDELVHATLSRGDKQLAEDFLWFAPLAEFTPTPGALKVDATRESATTWLLGIQADRVSRLVEIEADGRILCSDNYFAITPEGRKMVRVEATEPELPLRLSVVAWDGAVRQTLTLA